MNILITAPFSDEYLGSLRDIAAVDVLKPSMGGAPLVARAEDELSRAEVIITELDRIDSATLEAAPGLRLVIACRANPENVDLEACVRHGVRVATTPGRNAEVTADMAFTLLLMTVRQASRSERWMRAGEWKPEDRFTPYQEFRAMQLSGRTLAVLGGGAVGKRMVKRANGFGMRVKVYDPFLDADAFGEAAELVGLGEALSTADIVSVHIPLTDSTRGILGEKEFAQMRPGTYFINAARAAVIDEQALLDTLRSGKLGGVGLDVYHQEPLPPSSELFAMENIVMTPHIAGASDDVIIEHSRMAAEVVRAYAAQEDVPWIFA